MNLRANSKVIWLVMSVAFCLFELTLDQQSETFREYAMVVLSLQWMLLACLAIWCGTFLLLIFSLKDLLLIGLLIIVITAYFISLAESRPAKDAITLLFGVTLGKGARFFLHGGSRHGAALPERTGISQSGLTHAATFLVGLVALLAFASWWHLDMMGAYHGPRWMGLSNNPNDYGMLMAAGLILATGLIAASLKSRVQSPQSEIKDQKSVVSSQWSVVGIMRSLRSFAAGWFGERRRRGDECHSENGKSLRDSLRRPLPIILFIAVGMMGVGLVMSYSRGAWVGTAIGLLYLAKHTKAESGKRKAEIIWYLLPIVLLVATIIVIFWKTPDSAPWYFQRLDLSRGSVQHRVAAWKAGFEMMRDHPFGVGWNKAVSTYQEHYSPPENGAGAITTNDYLMLGTQLGIPALLCFIAYVALRFRIPKSTVRSPQSAAISPQSAVISPQSLTKVESLSRQDACATLESGLRTLDLMKVVCRAGALTMLVAFWFDGGLFKLPTASVFWILLELGSEAQKRKAETDLSLATSAATKE